MLPLEAVPNFSEGRDRATIEAIGEALSARARLLDVHTDTDHNRSVFTVVGDDGPLVDALVGGVACARDRIDLRRHDGAHPRIGAADVVPVVPLRRGDMERARTAALELARRIGGELELPVFLYGELSPDFGPRGLHPSAGGVIVGARTPLIAFNVDLRGGSVDDARAIAAVVRERDGGFPGVRALGLDLPGAGRVQVSMNVEDWEAAALHEIVARIEAEAAARGVEIAGSELVGLMPAGAAAAAAGAILRIEGFDATRLLELRLLDE